MTFSKHTPVICAFQEAYMLTELRRKKKCYIVNRKVRNMQGDNRIFWALSLIVSASTVLPRAEHFKYNSEPVGFTGESQ